MNMPRPRRTPIVLLWLALCSLPAALAQSTANSTLAVAAKPPDAPPEWQPFIGTYVAADRSTVEILEDGGHLQMQEGSKVPVALHEDFGQHFFVGGEGQAARPVKFVWADEHSIREVLVGDARFARRIYDADTTRSTHMTPVRPLEEIRNEALLASPPAETHTFRKPDLVELASLDPAIHLDIRYAGSNNFLGRPIYSQPRAFLQRPAALAMLAALKMLKPYGYGLMIHDGYRPWYVTKIFWEATPAEGKIFVADPAQGSRHNRGCAVDLSLYDLRTGAEVEMPGTYDEMSPRSFPTYRGGTSLQRWRRDLLRQAMEAHGFTVYEDEWWHFDYRDWKEYPILNLRFEELNLKNATAS